MLNDRMWILINGNRLELNQSPIEFQELELEINLDADKIEKKFPATRDYKLLGVKKVHKKFRGFWFFSQKTYYL